MAKTYLLSRTLDPILGIFTGLLAFHLNETNPRSAPIPGHTLRELIAWKWNENKELRQIRDREDENNNDWERVTRELGVGSNVESTEKK
ncbi:uncharacterized protein L201_005961 [Kwoniella dendrophila CBS 6074]|uniref:Uncharacterized protein n=1 Tax=Kwoniella dendrophila CBS 6074 TaxID=1295534 RepID=A0AAX4JZX7_9TREE